MSRISIDATAGKPPLRTEFRLQVFSFLPAWGLHLALFGLLSQTHWPERSPASNAQRLQLRAVVEAPHRELEIELEIFELPPPPPPPLEPPRVVAEIQQAVHLEADPPPAPPVHLLNIQTMSPTPPPRPLRAAAPQTPTIGELNTLVRLTLAEQFAEGTAAPSGGGEAVEEPRLGADGGPCVVFLVENSLAADDRDLLHLIVLRRIKALPRHKLFYVIAFDQLTHRMFNDFSPEPRPLAATPENLRLAAEWLGNLPVGQPGETKWASIHALHLQPDSIVLATGGRWTNPGLAAHLKNANRDAAGRPRVSLHVLALYRDSPHLLEQLARENGGACEFMRGRSEPNFVSRGD